jgi:tRNA dimethylallyltransferase
MRPRVGFIVGPTGVGKTAFAIEIAERLDAEIVNADSRQIYRGMDIGTAKPTAAERGRVAHHLLDRLEPNHPLNVADFARMAHVAIGGIVARRKRPLVVGGSGLYLRVLRGGLFSGPSTAPEVRAELAALAESQGSIEMHRRLAEVDAEAAARIHPNDLKRIVRALEVYSVSGTPISRHQRQHAFAASEFESLVLGLTLPRPDLYAAIDRRFDAMIAAGLVVEARALLDAGCDPGGPRLSAIGYREIVAYLGGAITLETAIEKAKRESRRLAKRQLTWFRAERETVWIDPREGIESATRLLDNFFKHGSVNTNG